ncbi:MAG: hypothetical protein J7L72_04725 [Candidatus Aminicenantes bacterium]|nr:hypothetical protein [Candidatus Aminicenantes bacterium]
MNYSFPCVQREQKTALECCEHDCDCPAQLKRKGQNPIADLRLVFRLARFYAREKPAIVHHFTIKPVIYGTLAARISRVPGIVNQVPGLGYVFSRGGHLQHIVEKMYRFAFSTRTHVIFQNPDDLNHFIRRKEENPFYFQKENGSNERLRIGSNFHSEILS